MSSPSAGRKVPKSNPETAHMLPIISLPGIRGLQNEPFYYLLSALIFPAALMKNHYCILPEQCCVLSFQSVQKPVPSEIFKKALKIYDNFLLSYTSLSLSVITCLVFIIYILV